MTSALLRFTTSLTGQTVMARFVDVINKTATAPLEHTRLPAQRLDELDSIAGAFNQLLDTLQVQYDNLENKVAGAQGAK